MPDLVLLVSLVDRIVFWKYVACHEVTDLNMGCGSTTAFNPAGRYDKIPC